MSGRLYTATRMGRAVKLLRCERCGGEYSCEVIRRTKGEGISPYFLRNAAAEAEAVEEAEQKLADELAAGIEPVPCPDCGWFHKKVVNEMRRRSYRWMLWTGWVFAGLLWVSAAMGLVAATEAFTVAPHQDQAVGVFVLMGIGLVVAMVFVGGRTMLIGRIDPNRGFVEAAGRGGGRGKAVKAA